MFKRTKRCRLSVKVKIRLNKFFYIFSLRQGAILIAIHQIALSSFILTVLLAGTTHVSDMVSMLQNDMEDDVERRGFYEVMSKNKLTFHEGDHLSTNNMRRFAKAQHVASVTVILLYTCTVILAIYLMSCIFLLYGAIKYKREFIIPWIASASSMLILIIMVIIVGDGIPCVITVFGGHHLYHIGSLIFVLTFIYAILAVTSFFIELSSIRCANTLRISDERGERLLLLDHAAQSSIISASQISKLHTRTHSHFV